MHQLPHPVPQHQRAIERAIGLHPSNLYKQIMETTLLLPGRSQDPRDGFWAKPCRPGNTARVRSPTRHSPYTHQPRVFHSLLSLPTYVLAFLISYCMPTSHVHSLSPTILASLSTHTHTSYLVVAHPSSITFLLSSVGSFCI
jgi:hypothetical protein